MAGAVLLFLGAFASFFHFLRICWSLTISLILLDFLDSIEVENMLQDTRLVCSFLSVFV